METFNTFHIRALQDCLNFSDKTNEYIRTTYLIHAHLLEVLHKLEDNFIIHLLPRLNFILFKNIHVGCSKADHSIHPSNYAIISYSNILGRGNPPGI